MRNGLMLVCIYLISNSLFAQVSTWDFEKEEYENLKNRTTLFVLDIYEKDSLEKAISEVWTFNDFKVISTEEYKDYDRNTKYAVFSFGSYTSTLSSSCSVSNAGNANNWFSSSTFTRNYYKLKYHIKDGKKKTKDIAKVYLSLNYGLGYLKNQLTEINRLLLKNEKHGFYGNHENSEKLADLKEKTLFVPEEIKMRLHPRKLVLVDRKDPDKLFKDYSWKYEYIDRKSLQSKILNATETFYYLMSTSAAKEKFVEVIDGYTGEIIYHDYNAMSVDLVPKNVEHLNSKIK
ncbi:hypothetical protein [uncultured Aquimarina sp.]|uniref:hypothetical protein n=1 Tax=uncultured Aquimarina sp. TaxID=575652 RepID=UPI002607BA6F|nr:hypothetical protein [uncultured Aquimarina sp.]